MRTSLGNFWGGLVGVAAAFLALGVRADVRSYDVVVAGGTQRAVATAEDFRRAGRSVCVLAPRNYLGEDVAGNLACVADGVTPLVAKRALDRRLLDCGADFLTGVFVLSVHSNEVRCASSCGAFTIGCRTFTDCRMPCPKNGFSRAARIVVSGTAPSAPGMTVRPLPGDCTTVVTNRVKEDGDGCVHVVSGRVWRCEFDLPFPVKDAFGKSAAELVAREKTWVPDLLDGADELIPLDAQGPVPPPHAASCEADVVVVGGGVAGAPAAIAAARNGAKVILVEALRQLGGMGTAGGIGQYWQGRRDGLTAEYDQRIRDLKPAVHGVGKREAWRRLVQEAGVTVLWGCAAYGVEKTGGRLVAVKVATDYGPLRLAARTFVDATGNANLAAEAGVPVEFLEKGPLAVQGSGVTWRPLGVGYMNTDWGYVNDSSVRDRTRFLASGRLGAQGVWDVSQLVGSRERRRIVAEVVLTDADMATGRKFSDVIVCTRSNFDSHGTTIDDLGLLPEPGSWLKEGAVPYRALLPMDVDNLLVAGLGLGATRDALPIIRMQPDVQNTGYAVGCAAALAAAQGGDCRSVDVKALQRKLVREGRLPEKALTWTDRTVSDDALAQAVRSIADDYRGAALALSERTRAIPLLKAAFAAAKETTARFRYAHVLGVLGEDDGAELLADWIRRKIDVPEPNLAKRPPYARRFDYRQSILIALGRTKRPVAAEVLCECAAKLSFDEKFAAHRAVCWAAASCGSREVGEILRRKAAAYPSAIVREAVRPKAGYSPKNHFMTDEQIAALKSLDIATAVFRLTGDDTFLKPWLDDVREVYRLQAERVLRESGRMATAGLNADIRWEPLYEPGGGGAIVSVGVSPHDGNHLIAGGDMLGVGVSFDGGRSWLPANKGLTSYEMATPTFHPTRKHEVWIGSCMGLFRSTDAGRSWTPSRRGMPPMKGGRYTAMIEKVLFDPSDAARMVAVGGSSRRWGTSDCQGAVWLSVDGGESWCRHGTVTEEGFVTNAVKGANIVKAFWGPGRKQTTWLHVMADKAGWFTSTDGGRTWHRRRPKGLAEPLANLTCHPKDPCVVWAVTGCGPADASGKRMPGRIYKSTDGGRNFIVSDKGLVPSRNRDVHLTTHFRDIEVSPVDPDVLYVSDLSWGSGSIWRSADGGASWKRVCRKGGKDGIDTACYAGPSCVVVPSPQSADCAYAFNSEYILKTTDAGRTWTDMTASRPDPAKPDHWRGRGWNGWCSQNYVFNPYRKGESMMVAMDAGHGWHSKDGLKSWRYACGNAGLWGGANDVAFSKDGYIYIATGQRGASSGVMVSADNGETWANRYGASCGLPDRRKSVYSFVWADPETGKRAFAVTDGDRYVTEDGGASWRKEPIEGGGGYIAADTQKVGRFYLKSRIGVRVTDDWKTFRNLGMEGEAEGRIVCDVRGRLLVCRGRTARERPGLWRYDPKEGSWTNLHQDRLAWAVAADPSDPTRLILVTNDMPYHDFAGGHGAFVSSDDGATWAECDLGGMMRRFSCVTFDPFDPTTIVAGMSGGGFIRGTWKK